MLQLKLKWYPRPPAAMCVQKCSYSAVCVHDTAYVGGNPRAWNVASMSQRTYGAVSRSFKCKALPSVVCNCLRFLVVLKEHRSESKCGEKSQRFHCARGFSVGLFCFFTSCIYAWFGFVLCIKMFSLVSIPPTWVGNLSYLEAVTSINFLARYVLFMCNFFCD
jgi:hypothetical protein